MLMLLRQVVEFVSIAKANGWIQPTVYQGRYNALERTIEAEYVFEHLSECQLSLFYYMADSSLACGSTASDFMLTAHWRTYHSRHINAT
jgi:aryl-alcohol dehydrogenase-like predicted oxidoreductase